MPIYYLGSGLRPRLLLLGIHPGLLARSDHYLSDETTFNLAPFLGALAAERLRDAKDEFMVFMGIVLNAAFPNRTRISHSSRVAAIEAKRRMLPGLAWGPTRSTRPTLTPGPFTC